MENVSPSIATISAPRNTQMYILFGLSILLSLFSIFYNSTQSLHTENTNISNRLSNLSTTVDTVQTTVDTVKTTVDTIPQTYTTKTDFAPVKDKVVAIPTNVSQFYQDFDSLKNTVNNVIPATYATTATVNTKVSNDTLANYATKASVENLAGTVATKASVESLSSTVAINKSSLDTLDTRVTANKSTLDTLAGTVATKASTDFLANTYATKAELTQINNTLTDLNTFKNTTVPNTYATSSNPAFTGNVTISGNGSLVIKDNSQSAVITLNTTSGAISATSLKEGGADLSTKYMPKTGGEFTGNVTIGSITLSKSDSNISTTGNISTINPGIFKEGGIDLSTKYSGGGGGTPTLNNPTFTGTVTIKGDGVNSGSLVINNSVNSPTPIITLGKSTGSTYIDSTGANFTSDVKVGGNINSITGNISTSTGNISTSTGTISTTAGTINEGGKTLTEKYMPKSGGEFGGDVKVGGITLSKADSSISTSGNISTTGTGNISTTGSGTINEGGTNLSGKYATLSGANFNGNVTIGGITLNRGDGSITTSGNISSTGGNISTSGNIFTSGTGVISEGASTLSNKYALKAGDNTFSGTNTFSGVNTFNENVIIGNNKSLTIRDASAIPIVSLNTNTTTAKAYIDNSGNLIATGTNNINGYITYNQASDIYAPKKDPTFTGNVTVKGTGTGVAGAPGTITLNDATSSGGVPAISLNTQTSGVKAYIDQSGNIIGTGTLTVKGTGTAGGIINVNDSSNLSTPNITLGTNTGNTYIDSSNNIIIGNGGSLSIKDASAIPLITLGKNTGKTFIDNGGNVVIGYNKSLTINDSNNANALISLNTNTLGNISTSGNISTTGTGSISTTGSGNISTTGTGNISSANTISSTGTISEAQKTLSTKYALSADMSNYAKLDGATFTGEVKVVIILY